jgi:diguanylate cyclase (GGDEF)-like protein
MDQVATDDGTGLHVGEFCSRLIEYALDLRRSPRLQLKVGISAHSRAEGGERRSLVQIGQRCARKAMQQPNTDERRPESDLIERFVRDPQITAEAARLLSGRTRDIRISGIIAAAFRRRTWRHTASVIRSWMVWVVLIDVFMLLLSLYLLPREAALALIAPAASIVPAALGVAYIWRKPRSEAVLGSALMLGMLVILMSVCWMGVSAGEELLDRYLHIMLFVAITGIVIFSVPFIQTVAIAVLAMTLYLGFQLGFADTDPGIALAGFLFFGSGIGATVLARRTMNILAHKSFLLELRDRQHLLELAQTNRRLERLSKIDGLTGTANRHLMRERMDELWERTGNVALLMCDIDHFKALNDHLGHQEGDRCLVEVARIIAGCTRSDVDCVARYGGEEFLILLPDTSESHALAVAERIRRKVSEARLPNPRSRVKPTVTISIGVAVAEIKAGSLSAEAMQKRADAALYHAKRAGRDRVHSWNESMETSVRVTGAGGEGRRNPIRKVS